MQRVSVRGSATCYRLDRVDARHRNREREFTPFCGGGIEVSLERHESSFDCIGCRDRFPTLNETKTNKVVPKQGRPVSEPHSKEMRVDVHHPEARVGDHSRNGVDGSAMADVSIERRQSIAPPQVDKSSAVDVISSSKPNGADQSGNSSYHSPNSSSVKSISSR